MDIECIRDILLQAEEKTFMASRRYNPTPEEKEDSDKNFPYIAKYESEKLFYHVNLADELGLIKVNKMLGGTFVNDLSAQGHLFLADIREENVWNKTKEISKQVGASSLDTVKQIAVNVVSSLISGYFQK